MKKIITKIISFAIIISLFTACGKEKVKNNETNEVKENKKVIYTSFYPLQSITKEIVGNKMEVRKLIPNGQEVHHWEPTAQDMKNLSEGSVILVNGLGLESWMDKFKASIKDLNIVEVSKELRETNEKIKENETELISMLKDLTSKDEKIMKGLNDFISVLEEDVK